MRKRPTPAPSPVLGARAPALSWRTLAVMGAAYLVLGISALQLTRLSGGIALMWLANGIVLAHILALPVRQWVRPLLVAAAVGMVASIVAGPVPRLAALFAGANIGEIVIGGLLLRLWRLDDDPLDSTRSVLLVVIAAGVAAPLASGAALAGACWLLFGARFLSLWGDWIAGHGLGTLIALPLTLAIRQACSLRRDSLGSQSLLRGAGLLLLVAGVTAAVFSQSTLPLLFVPFLPMLLATFSLGRTGAAASVILVAVVGGGFTLLGMGPITLVRASPALQLQFFQLYLATAFMMLLPVAGALNQRNILFVALQQSEGRYRLLADNATDVILNIAVDGTIRYVSPSVWDMAGFDPAELVGRKAIGMIHPDDAQAVRDSHRHALADPEANVTLEHRGLAADGRVLWFENNSRAVRDDDGLISGVVSAVRDIGKRKEVEALLKTAATTDPLTGLANRRAFTERLDRVLADLAANGGQAAIAILDLDFFKQINDTHGHAAGDVVLKTVADLCRRRVRSGDMVARLGGEEFAILFDRTGDAAPVCERLREEISAEEIIAADTATLIHLTASIGLAAIQPGGQGEEALRAADRALYQAKSAGRNCLRIAA